MQLVHATNLSIMGILVIYSINANRDCGGQAEKKIGANVGLVVVLFFHLIVGANG